MKSKKSASKSNGNRKPATAIYLQIITEIDRRRQELNFPMERFSEWAGLPERYFAKAIRPNTPSGRQAQWQTLQVMVDALFPRGFKVRIEAVPGEVIRPNDLKAKLLGLHERVRDTDQRIHAAA